jgi:hypothetical protein
MKFIKLLLVLSIFMLASVFVIAAETKIMSLDFSIDAKDSVQISNLKVDMGAPDSVSEEGAYSLEFIDGEGNSLYLTRFDVNLEIVADFFLEEGEEIPDKKTISLDLAQLSFRVPYFASASSYKISKGQTVLKEGELSFCNKNGVCEANSGESFLTCGADCDSGSSDEYCDAVFDDICDPDCQAQGRETKDTDCTCGNNQCDVLEDSFTCAADCGSESNPLMKYLYISIGVLVLLVGLIIWGIVHHHNKKKLLAV